MEKCRMVFSGSGGQGVITAAIILAEAAVLYENLIAVQAQMYGPEARGLKNKLSKGYPAKYAGLSYTGSL